MVIRLILLFTFLLNIEIVKGEIISLSGVYEGINLYVENDSVDGGSCVKDIFVNDQLMVIEKNNKFFEIDMSFLKLKEQVSIKIICISGCKAKVLNPEAINIMYGFQFMTITLEVDKIVWITTNEKLGGTYIVELHMHKKWIPIGEVIGNPKSMVTIYEKKMEPVKHVFYRVKYIDKDGISHSSKPLKYHSHH